MGGGWGYGGLVTATVDGVIDGKIYVAGTMKGNEAASTRVSMYDPATNLWTSFRPRLQEIHRATMRSEAGELRSGVAESVRSAAVTV